MCREEYRIQSEEICSFQSRSEENQLQPKWGAKFHPPKKRERDHEMCWILNPSQEAQAWIPHWQNTGNQALKKACVPVCQAVSSCRNLVPSPQFRPESLLITESRSQINTVTTFCLSMFLTRDGKEKILEIKHTKLLC